MSTSVPTKTKTAQAVHFITTPHDHDIIKGRGGAVNKHPGNVRFRMWVDARKPRYALCSVKSDKARIAQEVIDLVKSLSPPGRFLKKESDSSPSSSSSSSNYWVEMDTDAAMTKVSQALREGAPVIRLHLDQDSSSSFNPFTQPFPNTKQPKGKPFILPALGQQRPNALLCPSAKRPKSTSTAATTATATTDSEPAVQEKSNHKRRTHPGSEMSTSTVAGQQESVRLQVLQQQQEEAKAHQQQRSPKRPKPNPKAAGAAAAAAIVPGSPVQQEEQGYAAPKDDEQQKRPAAAPSSGSGKKGVSGSSRKRSTKTKTENSGADDNNDNNKNVPPTSLLLIQRLDQLEERQRDLDAQLLEEKKHRLKQEQRQGALELQLLEAKSMRMKQDDAIKSLRREIAQLQQQQRQRPSYSTAAAHDEEEDEEDGEHSRSSEGACVV